MSSELPGAPTKAMLLRGPREVQDDKGKHLFHTVCRRLLSFWTLLPACPSAPSASVEPDSPALAVASSPLALFPAVSVLPLPMCPLQ